MRFRGSLRHDYVTFTLQYGWKSFFSWSQIGHVPVSFTGTWVWVHRIIILNSLIFFYIARDVTLNCLYRMDCWSRRGLFSLLIRNPSSCLRGCSVGCRHPSAFLFITPCCFYSISSARRNRSNNLFFLTNKVKKKREKGKEVITNWVLQ